MISDEALLEAVRLAGPPGSGSHERALGVFDRAVEEWRVRDAAWHWERAERVVAERVAEVAEAVWLSVLCRRTRRVQIDNVISH